MVEKEYRRLQYHMIAAVSVRFRIFDVILYPDYRYIILAREHPRNLVYVVYERAYHAYSGYVVYSDRKSVV